MPGLRYALRSVRREPLQVGAVVVCLAIGIGMASTVFAFVDHIFLVRLPYPEADQIVRIWEEPAKRPSGHRLGMSYPHYLALLDASESLEQVALYGGGEVGISNGQARFKAAYTAVTARFSSIVNTPPLAGRWLSARKGEHPESEVVLAVALFRRLFGERPLAGQFVQIAERDYLVVGIMHDGFAFPDAATQVWLPYRPPPSDQAENRFSNCIAKRRKGYSNSQVAAEVAGLFDRPRPIVEDLRQALYGKLSTPLLWLGGGVGMVLLIALLNSATLQLARINRRWKDFSIRAALGESRTRLAGDLLTENLLLAVAGGLLGFLTFAAAFRFLAQSWPEEIPGIRTFSLFAPRPFLLLTMSALLSAFALGGVALWSVGKSRLQDRLGFSASPSGGSTVRIRANGLIVSAQLAITVVLLIAAGILTRSFLDAITVDLGYRPAGVLAALFVLPEDRYPSREVQRHAVDTLLTRIQAVDGVTAAGISSSLPAVARGSMTIQFPGREDLAPQVAFAQVSPDFFQALGLRLLMGRLPERRESEPTVVVNDSLVKAYLGSEPIGQTVLLGANKPYQVVGVVSDVLHEGFLGDAEAGLYFHYLQPPSDSFIHDLSREHLVIRVQGDPAQFASMVKDMVGALDPAIELSWVRPMNEILAEDFAQPRSWTILALALGSVALVFSMIALYALMSFIVTQRIPELAVRQTLGATPEEIRRLIFAHASAVMGRGLIIGVTLSLIVSALFGDLVFGSARLQVLTWAVCLTLLISAGFLAAYLPARRAAKAEPSRCLRAL